MSSLGFKALCIIINLLVLWSVYVNSSLVYFKKGPEYLTRETIQVFIPLMKLLLQKLLPRSFLLHPKFSFFTLSFICIMVFVSNIPTYLQFSFSLDALMLSGFGCSFPSIVSLFPLFIISMVHFPTLNSISIF